MKHNVVLTIMSALDSVPTPPDGRHRPRVGRRVSNLIAVPILVVWLYGTLVLAERRSGYIIMLLGSLLAVFVPYVHMKGKGVGVASRIANSSGHFFFVWTLLAIGVLGLFSAILSARGLWSLPWRRAR
jgi:hypothetical protein